MHCFRKFPTICYFNTGNSAYIKSINSLKPYVGKCIEVDNVFLSFYINGTFVVLACGSE